MMASASTANGPILSLEDGPTVTRAAVGSAARLLAVVSDDEEAVRAVDPSAGFLADAGTALALLEEVGSEAVKAAVADAGAAGPILAMPRAALVAPLEPSGRSITAARNDPSHSVKAGTPPRTPVLFPEATVTSAHDSEFALDGRALPDHEVGVALIGSALVDRPAD